MKTPGTRDDLRLTFYCKDPGSTTSEDCATFYRTNHGTWMVQGERQGANVTAQLRGFKPTETCVEIPAPLVDLLVQTYVKERYGIDLGGAAQ